MIHYEIALDLLIFRSKSIQNEVADLIHINVMFTSFMSLLAYMVVE